MKPEQRTLDRIRRAATVRALMELGFLIVGRRRITALKAAENAVKNTGHNDAIYTAYKSNSDFETAVSEVASAFHRTKYSGYGKMAEKVVGGLKKRGFLK